MCLLQVGSAQIRSSHVGPAQIRSSHVGPAQVRFPQITLTQPGKTHGSLQQYGPARKVGFAQSGIAKRSETQLSFDQPGLPQVSFIQQRPSQISPTQVSLA